MMCSLSNAAATNGETEPALPFTVKVTPLEKLDPVPDYLGGRWTGDYPPCAVRIADEFWVIHRPAATRIHRFKGTNIENAVIQPDGDAPPFPVERPYMLGRAMWYDEAENTLYAAMHCETPGYPTKERPNAGSDTINRQIHLATSTDKGLSWRYAGPIVTRDDPVRRPMAGSDFSGLFWDGGDGDFLLYVDKRGGYVYLFSNHYVWRKPGLNNDGFLRHCVARCAIADKMAPGKWIKFYNGGWTEPGLGGKASYVDGYYVMYNTYLKRYVSFDYNGAMTFCDDLEKQEWSSKVKIGDAWSAYVSAFFVTDENKSDVFDGGQRLYLYSFWCQEFAGAYQIEFRPEATKASPGYVPSSLYLCTPSKPVELQCADPGHLYPFEPLFESPDPIESRRTRRVGCGSPEVTYSGAWNDEKNTSFYEQSAKVSTTAGSSIAFSFKGTAIYWRAFKGEDCGKADVFLDGTLERTVDCYASAGTPFQFGFMKTGLDPKKEHTVKILVRGDKNPAAKGTAIRHLLFEYGAESYRASDCFSSVMGKHGWYYQEREPARLTPFGAEKKVTGPWYSNMRFEHPAWIGCGGKGYPEVGYCHMVPGNGTAAVRAWVAPHDGTVRIEGRVALALPDGVVNVEIRRRHGATVLDLWPRHVVAYNNPDSHDFQAEIAKDDVIYFVVEKKAKAEYGSDRTTWDPVITYVEP